MFGIVWGPSRLLCVEVDGSVELALLLSLARDVGRSVSDFEEAIALKLRCPESWNMLLYVQIFAG